MMGYIALLTCINSRNLPVIWLALSALFFSPCQIMANIPGGGTGTGANITLTDSGSHRDHRQWHHFPSWSPRPDRLHPYDQLHLQQHRQFADVERRIVRGNNGGGLILDRQPGLFRHDVLHLNPLCRTPPATTSRSPCSATPPRTALHGGALFQHAARFHGLLHHCHLEPSQPGMWTWASFCGRTFIPAPHVQLDERGCQPQPRDAGRPWRHDRRRAGRAEGKVTLWTSGLYAGQYEDKPDLKYSADLDSPLPAWGWSSVGTGGKNIGIWNITASPEYYPGGPLERSLMEHIGTTILNVFTGGYYGFSTDNNITSGETWSKSLRSVFLLLQQRHERAHRQQRLRRRYCTTMLSRRVPPSRTAWPYSWFNNTNYTPASQSRHRHRPDRHQ